MQASVALSVAAAVLALGNPYVQAANLESVVVTAQKRPQLINDVGMAVSAIGSATLANQKITSLSDIANAVPGLGFTVSSNNTPVLSLRGIGLNDNGPALPYGTIFKRNIMTLKLNNPIQPADSPARPLKPSFAGGGMKLARAYAGIVAALLVLFGLALLAGGIRLATLGGSWYYALAGAAALAAGVQQWRRSVWGERLYALMLAGTLGWALWESSLSFWPLLPRLALPAVLGLLLWSARPRPAPRFSPAGGAALLCMAVLALPFLRPAPQAAAAPPRPAALPAGADGDWPHYGNTLAGTRFSPLAHITPHNVAQLELAWTHRSGEAHTPTASGEATPLKIGESLYTCTPSSAVIALDAQTGAERWRYDPRIEKAAYAVMTCRGVSYYRTPGATGACAERIISTSLDARLFALDAHSGRLCQDFGKDGLVSLREGMGTLIAGRQYSTAPPTIVNAHVVLGTLVLDNQSVDVPSGVIRAFDPVSGALQWAWDMGAPERIGAPPAGQSYTRSTPNSWTIFAADPALNMVYVPTGNPSPDFYGVGRRPFDEQYGSAIVALDLDTGRPRWSFQTVHHDLWDYDIAAQPLLLDLPTAGGVKPALVQSTKRGDLFVLDRRTGAPIVPVTERSVPQTEVPAERASLTQPFSALRLPAPALDEASMWGLTPLDQMACRIDFRASRYEGMFTPPGLKQHTIVFPGLTGSVGWGGISVDADRRIVLANVTDFPWRLRLAPRTKPAAGIVLSHWSPLMLGTPYIVDQSPFLGPMKVPCLQPPWGSLSAIDLDSGKTLWQRPLGSGRDSGPLGMASKLPLTIGVPSAGGILTTRGGLAFISGTLDRYLRAFNVETGEEVWKARLPAGAQATPMTYSAGGRQFIVVTAGGHALLGTKAGDYTIAYALP